MKSLVVVAALAGCWTPQKTALGVTSTALLAADWYQTRDITRRCLELNPVIGQCGERVPVDVYFPLVMAGSLIAGHYLGDWWFGVMAGAEGATVWSNWMLD